MPRRDPIPALKVALFALALLPTLSLISGAVGGALGPNPIEALIRGHGDWALRLLLLTLAVTPLRRLTGWAPVMRLRRMLGLFAFFYACLHVSAYLVLDQFFDAAAVLTDILERPYITVGATAFVLLVPLAATSTRAMQRRLGGRRWRRLHTLVYPAAALAVLHYFMMVKADTREPLIYAAVLALLFTLRVPPLVRWAARRP